MPATKSKTMERIQAAYARFMNKGLTVSAACNYAESQIAKHERQMEFYRNLRNDMSTHTGSGSAKFDPTKHTHRFANL